MRYGSGRLIDVREGERAAQVRRRSPAARLGGLADRRHRRPPFGNQAGVFDDGIDEDQALWGAYATGAPAWLPFGSLLDLYYLGYHNDFGAYEQGVADETRLGRHASRGELGGWDWNWEAVLQWGSFGAGDILAWTVASDTGYTWRVPWTPRLG